MEREGRRQPPEVLVAIASYGTAQDHYLEMVLQEYRKIRLPCRIVVLSNQPKAVQGVELAVGLPSKNPYSLPFAHKKLFAENVEHYDLFIYTEDDVLITERNVEAFLDMQPKLEDGEILGFIRSETNPEGQMVITSIHSHFRWLPQTVVSRDGEVYARLSNDHSGCFIATRQQLRKAIASGGFLVEPHHERYGMLETAASDIYTQCGLKRLICLSRIQDFVVPHLANKYYAQMGIPFQELEAQVRTLADLYENKRWYGSLFNPQTRVPGFRWSKTLYERPDEELLQTVPPSTKNLLSVGSGWGENEMWLSKKGMDVCAVPVDAVFGDALRRRGICTVDGPIEKLAEQLDGQQFDAVLIADALHLVENPVVWLETLRNLLRMDGFLIARVSNTTEPVSWIKDRRAGHKRPLVPSYESTGAHTVTVKHLRRWFRAAAMELNEIIPLFEGSRRIIGRRAFGPLRYALADKFVVKARRRS